MVVNLKKRHIVGFVLGLYLIGYILIYPFLEPSAGKDPGGLPPPDPQRKPFVYDFNKAKWIYVDEMDNWYVPNITTKPFNTQDVKGRAFTEKDVQRYLETHIKDYKKKTYWGNTYEYDEFNDDHSSDPSDEFNDDYDRHEH